MPDKRRAKERSTQPAIEETALPLSVPPSAQEVRQLSQRAEAFAQRHRLSRKMIDAMLLALEEAVTNVLMYGFEGTPIEARELSVRFRKTAKDLRLTIVDNGRPFDPTNVSRLPSRDDERPGGWGIQLIRGLVDDVRYQRIGNRNRLDLILSIEPEVVGDQTRG